MDTTTALDLSALRAGPKLRALDEAHLDRLRIVLDCLPPIVVDIETLAVIDGAHRVETARRAGRTTIAATLTTFEPDDQLAAAVRFNCTHGLPLTMTERKAAARRLMEEDHGRDVQRSDALIAGWTGLSAATVRRLRPGPSETDLDAGFRVGVDGKRYPTNRQALHRHVQQLLQQHPRLSLNAIAREAGMSATTVAAIRDQMTPDEPTPRPLRKLLIWLRRRLQAFGGRSGMRPTSSKSESSSPANRTAD